MAVSLSLATAEGSVPVDYQLYLPHDWAGDVKRRREAKVPETVRFATKSQIALQQIRAAKERGLRRVSCWPTRVTAETRHSGKGWMSWS